MSKAPLQRLKNHNKGNTRSTKPYRPWRLIYIETLSSRVAARKREKYLKSGAGRELLNKILDP